MRRRANAIPERKSTVHILSMYRAFLRFAGGHGGRILCRNNFQLPAAEVGMPIASQPKREIEAAALAPALGLRTFNPVRSPRPGRGRGIDGAFPGPPPAGRGGVRRRRVSGRKAAGCRRGRQVPGCRGRTVQSVRRRRKTKRRARKDEGGRRRRSPDPAQRLRAGQPMFRGDGEVRERTTDGREKPTAWA